MSCRNTGVLLLVCPECTLSDQCTSKIWCTHLDGFSVSALAEYTRDSPLERKLARREFHHRVEQTAFIVDIVGPGVIRTSRELRYERRILAPEFSEFLLPLRLCKVLDGVEICMVLKGSARLQFGGQHAST